ncbi:prepronociceptin b [Astyanax mexicanus]|uniref:Prepronociceptin n=1 Tax=Astyanax mexicanus TaxID=7994 RepID=A0A8B9K0V4_ASTMX|nr:prepronociceptin b [Astyanax mexicanus]KAG9282656.1 prepronociceptin [Astyanax mexicanus]
MKTPLWTLLLLSLCAPGHSDCQGDCLTCGLLLPPQQAFNTLVCLLECEAQASPAHTWDLCKRAVGLNSPALPPEEGAVSKRSENEADEMEPLAMVSVENDGSVEFSEALERFRHAAQALGSSYEAQLDSQMQEEAEQGQNMNAEEEQDGSNGIDLSKRFGGFLKGRHGFRKLVGSGRPLQKRYGGFIGIRKSARKWNNQKRVSQLLRQYLSLTARSGRSGRFNNLSTAVVRQKNEV